MKTLSRYGRIFLGVEFFLLCIVLPTIIIAFKLAPFMFVFLWSATAYCALRMYRRRRRGWLKRLWKWSEVNVKNLRPIILRWVLATIGMIAFIYFYDPDKMFIIFEQRPEIIPYLLLAYPVLSALPQEFIFCSFFFHRYRAFFTTDMKLLIASAIVFAYAHVLFINWVAPVLSLIAGLIFAHTYARTKSLALVTIEHGLYGNSLFLVGLGWYFWGGAVAHNYY